MVNSSFYQTRLPDTECSPCGKGSRKPGPWYRQIRSFLAWIGDGRKGDWAGDYDPARFDLQAANVAVAAS